MKRFICLTLCLAAAAAGSAAGTPAPRFSRSLLVPAEPAPPAPRAWLAGPAGEAAVPGLRKPALGVLFSAVLPGAGQAYAGSWIRAAVYTAVEAGLWAGYARLTDQGNTMRTEFRAFADEFWSKDRWEENKQLYPNSVEPTTHELPETKTQQYYEMIGKYDEFKQGWVGWQPDGPDLTWRRDHYETLRDRHNRKLINASYCAMAALGNRLVSCFDAGFTIRNRNRTLQARLETGTRFAGARAVPVLGLRMEW
jgi:hypothetical protein